MNVLIEMTALAVRRPGPGASRESVAAWYEAKARLHAFLASEGGPDSAREHALAASAQQHSMQLRQSVA